MIGEVKLLDTKERTNLNKAIGMLKADLEFELEKKNVSYERVLSISRQLDELILDFYRLESKAKKEA